MKNRECPPEGEEWLAVLEPYSREHIGYHVSIFLAKVARFQAQSLKIIKSGDTAAASANYASLFGLLMEAENGLGQFVSSMNQQAHHASDGYMTIMHLSSIVKVYNLLLLLTNLTTHDPMNPTPLETLYKRRQYCLGRVRDAAWKILAGVPPLIAELIRSQYNVFSALFQAMRLVWPLTTVRLAPSTLPRQKAQAAQVLILIGKQLGVRQASRNYNMADGIPEVAMTPRKPSGGPLKEIQFTNDMTLGYLDGELRQPTPEELGGDAPPPESSLEEGLESFMI